MYSCILGGTLPSCIHLNVSKLLVSYVIYVKCVYWVNPFLKAVFHVSRYKLCSALSCRCCTTVEVRRKPLFLCLHIEFDTNEKLPPFAAASIPISTLEKKLCIFPQIFFNLVMYIKCRTQKLYCYVNSDFNSSSSSKSSEVLCIH